MCGVSRNIEKKLKDLRDKVELQEMADLLISIGRKVVTYPWPGCDQVSSRTD